jgi:hypothetical protein
MNAKTAQQSTTATTAQPVKKTDNTAPIAAGGALALLAIGGAAYAMRRRRHEDEEMWVEEDTFDDDHATMAHEPVEMAEETVPVAYEQQSGFLAPPVSAFNWGDAQTAAQPATDEPLVEQDDREPGETWIERAYRGPSPLNPSVSLKTRLRRAAFFDKRERDAAAGLATPVDPTAGLPDRMVAEREGELA